MLRLMKFVLVIVCSIELVCLAAAPSKRSAIDPPQGTFHDRYYSLYLGPAKCGWAHTELVRKKDTVFSRMNTYIQFSRGAQKGNNKEEEVAAKNIFTLFQDAQTTETLAGEPLSFYYKIRLGGSETVYQGSIRDGQAVMTISQGPDSTRHTFRIPKDVVMTWGEHLKGMQAGTTSGTRYQVTIFDPQLGPGKFVTAHVTVLGPARQSAGGNTISGIKTITRMKKPFPINFISIIDDQGYPLMTEIPLGLFTIQLVAVEKRHALENLHTKELFLASFIMLDRPLKFEPSKPLYLKLTVSGQSPQPLDIPETPTQKIIEKTKDQIILKTLPRPSVLALPTPPATTAKSYLADSIYLNLNDPLLRKLVKGAIGPNDPPLVRAGKLTRLVDNHITTKDLSVAFGSAAVVARIRRGDCTEHAVLLAALGRIAKNPTRTVNGLIYSESVPPNGAFIYHMWTQFFIEGRWLDFDGTRPGRFVGQKYITVSISDMTEADVFSQMLSIVQLMGRLKIEQAEAAVGSGQ